MILYVKHIILPFVEMKNMLFAEKKKLVVHKI